MKKMTVLCAAFFLFLTSAQAAYAQMNTSLYIEEIKYRRNGNIDIEFDDNTVRNVSVAWSGKEVLSVFDRNGTRIPAEIDSRGFDWLRFRVPDIRDGETYTFEVRNVAYGTRRDIVYTAFFVASPGWKIEYKEPPRFRRARQESENPATEVFIREMEYDRGGSLEVSFAGSAGKRINIEWDGNEKVVVTDEAGKVYQAGITEYERNKLEIRIFDIVENMNYNLEISNVPFDSEKLSFKISFKARDDWKYRMPRLRAK